MQMARLYAATGDGIARVDETGEAWTVELALAGSGAQCLAVDPTDADTVYAGLREGGVRRSVDRGRSWIDCRLPELAVFSLAVSAADGAVYAGTEPSRLFRSEDRGDTWRELEALLELPSRPSWSFPPRPWTSHVRWIAPSPHDPDQLLVGIELGGLMRSTDGGQSWQDHRPGAQPDVHSLAWHPHTPGRAYEAGGGGTALSIDAGETWRPVDEGRDRHYAWSIAVDPDDADCWYVSASTARSLPMVAAIRRRASTGGATANPGSGSRAGSRSRCRRCPTHSSPPTVASSPASPTASSGRAATAAIPGRRVNSKATASRRYSRSGQRLSETAATKEVLLRRTEFPAPSRPRGPT